MAQVEIKSADEIARMREAGRIVCEILDELERAVAPGVSTWDLDALAEKLIRAKGAKPAFKGYHGFPSCLCASVNHEVVHGIPSSRRRLAEGDVVSIDCGVKLEGFYADAAVTLPVGAIGPEVTKLLETTRQSLQAGISEAHVGQRLGDIGAAIQEIADRAGYGIVRDLVGHGIGRSPHEEPQVPNYGRRGRGMPLEEGLVLAIEPMLNLGTPNVRTLADRWTVVTADRKVSAHFEHTVAITAEGPRVLTPWRLD